MLRNSAGTVTLQRENEINLLTLLNLNENEKELQKVQ